MQTYTGNVCTRIGGTPSCLHTSTQTGDDTAGDRRHKQLIHEQTIMKGLKSQGLFSFDRTVSVLRVVVSKLWCFSCHTHKGFACADPGPNEIGSPPAWESQQIPFSCPFLPLLPAFCCSCFLFLSTFPTHSLTVFP